MASSQERRLRPTYDPVNPRRNKRHHQASERVWRKIQPDERYVLRKFERHVKRCQSCCRTHFESRWYRPQNSSLCTRGHMYAFDLLDYLVSDKGAVFSRFATRAWADIDFDPAWDIARSLLVAVEYGMRVEQQHRPYRSSADVAARHH